MQNSSKKTQNLLSCGRPFLSWHFFTKSVTRSSLEASVRWDNALTNAFKILANAVAETEDQKLYTSLFLRWGSWISQCRSSWIITVRKQKFPNQHCFQKDFWLHALLCIPYASQQIEVLDSSSASHVIFPSVWTGCYQHIQIQDKHAQTTKLQEQL